MKSEEIADREIIDSPPVVDVEMPDSPGRIERIQKAMRAEVISTDRKYFYAQHVAKHVLSPELSVKLDRFCDTGDEVVFTEGEEDQITEACQKIFDFFDQNFPVEYFDDMDQFHEELPGIPSAEIDYRFNLGIAIDGVVADFENIETSTRLIFPEDETGLSKQCQTAIAKLTEIHDRYCQNRDIDSADDQVTIHHGSNEHSLQQAISVMNEKVSEIGAVLEQVQNDQEYIKSTSQELDDYRTQLDELTQKKGRTRKFLHSIAPSTISAREKKIEGQIKNLELQLEAKHQTSDGMDIETSLADKLGKILVDIDALVARLDYQQANPPKPPESDDLWGGLAMVHATNRPIAMIGKSRVIRSLGHEPYNLYQRFTVHFTLNQVVFSHLNGNWDSRESVIVSPAKGIVEENGEPDAVGQDDSWFSSDISIPDGSVVFVRTGSPPIMIGRESLDGIKIVACEDPIEASKKALTEMGYETPYGGNISPLRRLEENGYRLALSEEHYDSVQMNLERQASNFMLKAIAGDAEYAEGCARRFYHWFDQELPKLPEKIATQIRQNFSPVTHAMESYFGKQGQNLQEIRETVDLA